MDRPPPDLELLTTAADWFTARLLAARLGAAGIPAQVKGESAGPYPVTVGRMAGAPVFVPSAAIEEATRILSDFEDAQATPLPGPAAPAATRRLLRATLWVVAVVLVLTVFLFGPRLLDGIT